MIRIRTDGSIGFSGSIQIAIERLCRYFKCKPEELEAFLVQRLKEGVKRTKN